MAPDRAPARAVLAVSPFARPHDVSHAVADQTSLLAFIETVFLPGSRAHRQHLTERDRQANDLLDLFDFARAPSLDASVGLAALPTADCTPVQ